MIPAPDLDSDLRMLLAPRERLETVLITRTEHTQRRPLGQRATLAASMHASMLLRLSVGDETVEAVVTGPDVRGCRGALHAAREIIRSREPERGVIDLTTAPLEPPTCPAPVPRAELRRLEELACELLPPDQRMALSVGAATERIIAVGDSGQVRLSDQPVWWYTLATTGAAGTLVRTVPGADADELFHGLQGQVDEITRLGGVQGGVSTSSPSFPHGPIAVAPYATAQLVNLVGVAARGDLGIRHGSFLHPHERPVASVALDITAVPAHEDQLDHEGSPVLLTPLVLRGRSGSLLHSRSTARESTGTANGHAHRAAAGEPVEVRARSLRLDWHGDSLQELPGGWVLEQFWAPQVGFEVRSGRLRCLATVSSMGVSGGTSLARVPVDAHVTEVLSAGLPLRDEGGIMPAAVPATARWLILPDGECLRGGPV